MYSESNIMQAKIPPVVTGLDVDLVEYQLIKPVLRDNILKDEIRIYHARTTRLLVPVGHS